MKKSFSDKEIIVEIRAGNSSDVLKYLYRHVQPKITSWIQNNNGSREEAQDIFQDAVVVFYRYLLEGKYNESNSVAGFLFSVSRNMWINRAKEKGKYVDESLLKNTSEPTENYLDQTIKEERAEKVRAVLSKLGERCKELLTLSIFYKLSMEEISRKMKFNNADTAKSKNYKCKQRLIALIKENDTIKDWLYK